MCLPLWEQAEAPDQNRRTTPGRIPPIVAEGYEPKGKYIDLDGLKTSKQTSRVRPNATTAILSVYDIFGFYPQTIQGTDILAHSDKERQYQVFIPDSKEKGEKNRPMIPIRCATEAPSPVCQLLSEPRRKLTPTSKIGALLASLIASDDKTFKAAVQTSPAMVDASDAEKVVIPMMMLASKDEPKEDVSKYQAGTQGVEAH